MKKTSVVRSKKKAIERHAKTRHALSSSPAKKTAKSTARVPSSDGHARSRSDGSAHGQAHSHSDGHAHGQAHSHSDGHAHGHHSHSDADGHAHSHSHSHSHSHTHSDADADAHSHGHGLPAFTRPDLPAGAGRGRTLFFDAPSGLAGDMIIAALVDLGVPPEVIERAVAKLPVDGYHLHFGTRSRSGIVATSFDVHVEGRQPHRTYADVRAMLDRAALAPGVKARAHATFRLLAEAEAKVHRAPIDDVHFHEVGAVDAIVDVVGSAAALEHLGARLVVSPLPMGHGRIVAAHGVLPLPPPAVVECLRGMMTYDGGIAFELVTPTGAAIVAAHAEGQARWPTMAIEHAGWGAGTADLADRPNLLRAVLGVAEGRDVGASSPPTHVVLEANLDDATGELVGHCIERLLGAGALDAWASAVTMKKGRPGYVLSALAPASLADELAALVVRESTTLGVRRHGVSRLERPRRLADVETRFGVIPVKIAEGPFGRPRAKPEFDRARDAALAHGVPVREVLDEASAAALQLSGKASPGDGTRRNPEAVRPARKRRG